MSEENGFPRGKPRELTPEELREKVIAFFGGEPPEFRSVAFWHGELNTVVVVVRDCNTCHVRINDGLTLMEDNYPEPGEDKYAGFEVHATPKFYEHEGLLFDGQIDLNRVLDLLARRFPNNLSEVGICRRLLEKLKTTNVELA